MMGQTSIQRNTINKLIPDAQVPLQKYNMNN